MEQSYTEFVDEIKKLASKRGFFFRDTLYWIDKAAEKDEHERRRNLAMKNVDLIGRYFMDDKRYYKVISIQSSNEFRVECLCFNKTPEAEFNYFLHKNMRAGDGFLGGFEFDSFIVESIMASKIRELEEIDKEVFDEAARGFLDTVLNMEWRAKEARWTGTVREGA